MVGRDLPTTQKSFDIKDFRYIHEGQRAQVVMNERNIRRQPRNLFIDILKRLEVRQVYCDKKCLFEWIGYGNSSIQYLTEDFIDELRHRQRLVDRFPDTDRDCAQSP